jgi:hypothetical protein
MIIVAVVILVGIGIAYFVSYRKDKKEEATLLQPTKTQDVNSKQLQLAAYERLVILADRIALPNLISRVAQPNLSKTEMQQLLTQSIRQEFDYNLSQQIYVSTAAWDAVRNLKEQNIHVVNQVAAILPAEATGLDLNKNLIDLIMQQPQGSMHTMVQDALSYEAKKLM